MSNWTHAACPACFAKLYGDREPARLASPEWELCCFCADGTDAGIYVRADPLLLLCEGIHEGTSPNPG